MNKEQYTAQELRDIAQTIDAKQAILPEYVEIAWRNRGMKISNSTDAFFLLASLNLLNSAIKTAEYKKKIHYRGIKVNVSRVIEFLLEGSEPSLVEEICINPKEGYCAYIKAHSFQFAFHNIRVSQIMKDFVKSEQNEIKPWEGVRLQLIANDLFRYALDTRGVSDLNNQQ